MCWHFACLQMSTFCLFVSLLEHYQCFPRKDVCVIFVLGSVSRNTVPRVVFPNTLPREQEVYRIVCSLKIMSFNIIPVATEYQEIHPYSVVNIDNVKINTTSDEIMVNIQTSAQLVHVKNLVFSNTQNA